MWERWSMAVNTGLAWGYVKCQTCVWCHQLQCCHHCVREVWWMAAGPKLVPGNIQSWDKIWYYKLQCDHQCIGEGRSMGASIGLVQYMSEAIIRPNIVCYTTAITTCQNSGEWQWALALFAAMSDLRMLCDITFSAFITACGDGGMWQLSLALFETISIARVLADSSAAISACQKAVNGSGLWLCFRSWGSQDPTGCQQL